MKTENKTKELTPLAEKIINNIKVKTGNNLLLTKKELVSLSSRIWKALEKKGKTDEFEFQLSKKVLDKNKEYTEIVNILKEMVPSLVANTVRRYENGWLANIFSSDEMTALAHQKILDVLSKYREGGIDMKGLRSYFKTSFKNHSQKVYESHGGTDIRGGIRTVGSDEAMNVAMNINLYTPEKQYIINDTMTAVYRVLLASDTEFNEKIQRFNSTILTRQSYHPIIKGLVAGNTAEETRDQLGITMAEYLRQKRLAMEHLKKTMPDQLRALFDEFEVEEDKRIHTQVVEKRTRRSNPENKTSIHLFIREQVVGEKKVGSKSTGGKLELSVNISVKVVDKFNNPILVPKDSKLVNGKSFCLKTEVLPKNSKDKELVKNNLLNEGKSSLFLEQIEKLSQEFFNEFQEDLAKYYANRSKKVA